MPRAAQEAFALTSGLLERNPYALEAMPMHLTSALELRKKNELFLRGHRHAIPTYVLVQSVVCWVRLQVAQPQPNEQF